MNLKYIINHIRDILILPFSVTVVIPYLIYMHTPSLIPGVLAIKILSLILFLTGLVLFSWTIYLFQTLAKGTLAPWTDKQKLVTSGPYQYCRNPMITGVVLILAGEALWFRSMSILIWTCVFIVINTCFFVFREEPFLEQKFGDEYKKYKSKIPRWIPNWYRKL